MSKIIPAVIFFVLTLAIFPSTSYAAVSCSLLTPPPDTGRYHTGDNIQVDASTFTNQSQNYDLELVRLDDSSFSTTILYSFVPGVTIFPLNVSIPLIPSGRYDLQITPQSSTGTDGNICASNIIIINDGSGPPVSGRNCSLSPSTIPPGGSVTISGNNFPDTDVAIFSGSTAFGTPTHTDSNGSFTKSISLTTLGSTPLSAVYQDSSTGSNISTDCGVVTVALPACPVTTKPNPLYDNAPQANFTTTVGSTATSPDWAMYVECGLYSVVSLPAKIDPSDNTKIISNDIINGTFTGLPDCRFSTGTHTIKIVNGSTDFCSTAYTVLEQSSSTLGTCSLTLDTPPKIVPDQNKCTSGATAIIITGTTGGDPPAPTYSCSCALPGPGVTPIPALPTVNPAQSGGLPCTSSGGSGFVTAIGCVPTDPAEFVNIVLKFVMGIAGGLAFLLMLIGAFEMLSSAGNPETLHAGRERFTQAIIGLLFIIFSVLLLQVIGVDILGLRELGG